MVSAACFGSPEIDKKDRYTIFWLPQAEAEDYKEALRAAKAVTAMGIVTRIDNHTGARRYGIRVPVAEKDKAATKLGKPVGTRYYIKDVPIEWIEQDVLEFAKQMGWSITIPNPQTAVRVRRGVASWAVRASVPPAVRSAVVMSGDERVTLVIAPAEDKRPQPRQASAPPSRSWASVVASVVRTPQPDVEDQGAAKKRKADTQTRARSEPPEKNKTVPPAKPKTVTFETKPDKKDTDQDQMQMMFSSLMAQMKEMQVNITALGSRMGCIEDVIHTSMHNDSEDPAHD